MLEKLLLKIIMVICLTEIVWCLNLCFHPPKKKMKILKNNDRNGTISTVLHIKNRNWINIDKYKNICKNNLLQK